MSTISFIGWALDMLQDRKRVRRKGWNGKGMWLELVPSSPYPGGAMMHEFVALRTVDGTFVPWTCSQSDLLASDWEEAK